MAPLGSHAFWPLVGFAQEEKRRWQEIRGRKPMSWGRSSSRFLLAVWLWAGCASSKSHSSCWVILSIRLPFPGSGINPSPCSCGPRAGTAPPSASPRYCTLPWSLPALPTPAQIISLLNSPQITRLRCALCFLPGCWPVHLHHLWFIEEETEAWRN